MAAKKDKKAMDYPAMPPSAAKIAKGNTGMSATDGIAGKQKADGEPCIVKYPGYSTGGNKNHSTHPHIKKAAGTRTGSR